MNEEECKSCRIVIGGIEERYLSDYRGHQICSWCINQWRNRETRVGRELSWEEFIHPDKETLKCLK